MKLKTYICLNCREEYQTQPRYNLMYTFCSKPECVTAKRKYLNKMRQVYNSRRRKTIKYSKRKCSCGNKIEIEYPYGKGAPVEPYRCKKCRKKPAQRVDGAYKFLDHDFYEERGKEKGENSSQPKKVS